ncbi:hypothetical protein L2E82_24873 [Cichorium intybus]|uniref:Uncharacterized protein n=1 Tax=Cichorium intybus TaxID=13427 RepID=A0ACB9E1X5_CICIN|nr:hypothetical protein L2E82_24873 [Cichorium intybus]
MDDDPKTFNEAMTSRDAQLWKEAINDEMDSIMGNDGSISAYKARLVAKGYKQREDIDYFNTYAPVAKISSIRTLIAILALKGLYIHQMDVKTTFLNGYLKEEIYLEQPEGFAPKQWHERFDTTVTAFRFQHNSADRCVYCKCKIEYTIIICLYVDDMLIIDTHIEGILETKKYLSSNFKMKDLGEVDTILGIKVKRTGNEITLSQSHYIENVFKRFQHLNTKEFNNPFESSVKLKINSGRAVAQLEYASVIGSMMYARHYTRPDIAFAISKLSQYSVNPGTEHWKAVGRVLGCLKRTSTFELTYTPTSGILEGYFDVSKKQTCITHSTMEAELIALAAAGKEVKWIRDLLLDIRLWDIPMPTIPVYCDSEATMR